MMDLHMHTVYSDGKLREEDIFELSKRCSRISITDHNSVGMYLQLSGSLEDKRTQEFVSRAIIGVELTIEGYPDLLAYYPTERFSSDNLATLEKRLQAIRIDEEEAIKEAYYSLGLDRWDSDKKMAFPDYARVSEARTMELASILYQRRTSTTQAGHFERKDLLKARIARQSVREAKGKPKTNPYAFGRETGCQLVLAHPIRTAIKFADRSKDYMRVAQSLEHIFSAFSNNGGCIIEWEYLDCEFTKEFDRYPVLQYHFNDFRELVKHYMDEYSFCCVWGSDTHGRIPANYPSWGDEPFTGIKNNLPEWLKC